MITKAGQEPVLWRTPSLSDRRLVARNLESLKANNRKRSTAFTKGLSALALVGNVLFFHGKALRLKR